MQPRDAVVVDRARLGDLLEKLIERGYAPIGPTVADGAIKYEPLRSIDDLPAGWRDEQAPGRYRLVRGPDAAVFGYTLAPQSWKAWLYPPTLSLWRAVRGEEKIEVDEQEGVEARPLALFGVRACELFAIRTLDRVLLGGAWADPHYRRRREGVFIVAANCGTAGATCFCSSLGTGPRALSGFDVALSEILDDRRHEFVLEAGSPRGADVLAGLGGRAASAEDLRAVDGLAANAAASMGRRLETEGLREGLYAAVESRGWEEIGRRCLTCGNCTLVCPTCFCTTIEDTCDLAGQCAERVRRWDSCFSLDFSYIHGGCVRGSPEARYRQWLTHKLAAWHDQFGGSGCVGCGRCITWCPVGIDITAEAAALARPSPGATSAGAPRGDESLPAEEAR